MKIGSVLPRGGGAGTSATIAEGSASEGAEAGLVDRALTGLLIVFVRFLIGFLVGSELTN